MTDTELRTLGVIIAALGGAAIGIERERSGHAEGPGARFAGVRTFTLLGGLAGLSGWLWAEQMAWLAVVLLASAAALVVVATSVLSLPLTVRLLPLIAAPLLVGVAALLIGLRQPRQERPEVSTLQNPLQFGAARWRRRRRPSR